MIIKNSFTLLLLFLLSSCALFESYEDCVSSAKLKYAELNRQYFEALSLCSARYEKELDLFEFVHIPMRLELDENESILHYQMDNQSEYSRVSRIVFHVETVSDDVLDEKLALVNSMGGAEEQDQQLKIDIAVAMAEAENRILSWSYSENLIPVVESLDVWSGSARIHARVARMIRSNKYSKISYTLYGISSK